MSGTFENIDVPPTLVSFAVSTASSDKVISPEFKTTNSSVILVSPIYDKNHLPDFNSIRQCFEKVESLIASGRAKSVWAVSFGGVSEAICKMSFGNKIGFKFTSELTSEQLFQPCYGSFVIELNGIPS